LKRTQSKNNAKLACKEAMDKKGTVKGKTAFPLKRWNLGTIKRI
jgi:hypothetical protein